MDKEKTIDKLEEALACLERLPPPRVGVVNEGKLGFWLTLQNEATKESILIALIEIVDDPDKKKRYEEQLNAIPKRSKDLSRIDLLNSMDVIHIML